VNEKGFDVLFKAIPQMETNKKYVFVFAGEVKMSYEDTYEKLKSLMEPIQDKVFILGLLNDAELLSFYKMIDIIVMPSRSDCFPLVQAEATIAGAPSICADIPGARMLVKTTGYGVLFAKENDRDLAEKLDEVIEDPKQFRKNHSKVLQMFDINANTRKIADYLK
jgi:glycosyltransferase involved in cell wall biosynthesis